MEGIQKDKVLLSVLIGCLSLCTCSLHCKWSVLTVLTVKCSPERGGYRALYWKQQKADVTTSSGPSHILRQESSPTKNASSVCQPSLLPAIQAGFTKQKYWATEIAPPLLCLHDIQEQL
ncbi:hypothetical protein KIL84_014267 [Mauremys mutica]|uniref:Uncharacterized protein n=1 Tax=Mauremys mutica TaxID=74926 RepID=A0A9D3XQD9_9SAUR|nr:hypothetical protein KIL84_014267 [Mauremys mutica]